MTTFRFGLAGLTLCATIVGFAGCSTEIRPVGTPDIRAPEARELYADEAIHKIWYEGKHAGTLITRRFIDGDSNDYNDKRQWFVEDLNGHTLGFITQEMKTYRLRAHGAPEFIANHPRLENDVRAILGFSEGELRLERQVVKND